MKPQRRVLISLRLLLACSVVAAGFLKIVFAPDPSLGLPRIVFIGIGAAELGLGAILFRRLSARALVVLMVLFAGGAGLALLTDRPCGCLGPVVLDRWAHAFLSSVLGGISGLLLFTAPTATKIPAASLN